MTRRSLGEITATVLKAARASGVPLAQAEDIARASAFLAPEGFSDLLKALEVTAHSLEPQKQEQMVIFPSAQVALAASAAIDLLEAGYTSAILKTPDAPQLLTALVKLANADGLGPFHLERKGSDWRLERTAQTSEISAPTHGIDLEDEVWAQLDRLASETYVPATDESRLKGAGAGLSDND